MNSHRLSSFSSSSSFQLSASCGIWTYSHDPHLENSLPALHIFAAKNIVCDIYRSDNIWQRRQNLQGNGKGEPRSSESDCTWMM